MKMEEVINGLFKNNTKYETPDQATKQASSLVWGAATITYLKGHKSIFVFIFNVL